MSQPPQDQPPYSPQPFDQPVPQSYGQAPYGQPADQAPYGTPSGGQPGAYPPPYQAMPYETGASPYGAAPARRPSTVIAAVVIQVVAMLLGIVGLLVLIGRMPHFGHVIWLQAPWWVLHAGLLVAVWLRQNWARWVFGALVVVGTITTVVQSGGFPWANLLTLTAVVLLFLPASNAWFRKQAR